MKRVIWVYLSVIVVLALASLSAHLFYKDESGFVPASGSQQPTNDPEQAVKLAEADNIFLHSTSLSDSIIAFARTQLGTEYKYGSCTPGGFDCSGFVFYVFGHFGINLPRSSITMGEMGTDIPLERADLGDLIFFTGTSPDDPDIGHVGIVITPKGEPLEFIHSSSSTKESGVKITPLTATGKYMQRFVRVKRVF